MNREATTGATWTTERVQQLQRCVIAGLTCSEIADEIGVTRNAVIGKIHRLGLSPGRPRGRRPAALAQRMRTAPAQARRPPTRIARILRAVAAGQTVLPFQTTIEVPGVESALRCSLLDLPGGRCRWPLSDPGKPDFGFCGNDAIAGISYCAGHARLAYRLPSGRRA
jgi:GcrA cell cycle regulator